MKPQNALSTVGRMASRSGSGRAFAHMLRALTTAICISLSAFLVGCSTGVAPTIITPSTTPTRLLGVVETEPTLTPTGAATAIRSEPPISSNASRVLESAVANLLNAASFEMTAHEVRAYRAVGANGEIRRVYGEFNTNYAVNRLPLLKVYGSHEYRYDPQAGFFRYDSYTYQENGQYFTQLLEDSVTGAAKEIDLRWIEPFAGDVYQTLVTYSDQARFVTQDDGMAVYVLDHPKWYVLEGAIGFADLGFLYGQEDGEQSVERYVAEHYPNVETIVFTIYVAVDERVITRVEIDDRDFMASLWAEVDRALIEQGAEAETLTRYVIMDENGSEYLFSNYSQVQDLEISR
jgi:hypothetical protein